MSAIAGVVRLDERPIAAGEIAALAAALAPHGEAVRSFADQRTVLLEVGGAGRQPQTGGPEAGQAPALAADVRLDARRELAAALGLGAAADVALARTAFEAWGTRGAERLLGDFAIAFWQPRCRRLTLWRDAMGVRPLCYAFVAGRFFAFASEPGALLSLPEVPARLDEVRIAEFLFHCPGDAARSFYADIKRLPPAHALVLENGALSVERCWQPRGIDVPGTLEARGEALAALVDEAVRDRLRDARPLGVHLSGGLDSSAVAVLAARALREESAAPTGFTYLRSRPPAPESEPLRAYVLAVAEQESIRLQYAGDVPGLKARPAPDHPGWNDVGPEAAVRRLASGLGVRRLLSGWGGDQAASFGGHGRLSQMLAQGRILELARLLAPRGRDLASSASLLRRSVEPLLPSSGWLARFRGAAWQPERLASIANPEFARRVGLLDLLRARPAGWAPDVRANQRRALGSPAIQERLEAEAYAGARAGLVYAYPLLDRRVVELSLACPADDFGGRRLFRVAMRGILPEPVRQERRKLIPTQLDPPLRIRGARALDGERLSRYLDADLASSTLPAREAILVRARAACLARFLDAAAAEAGAG